MSLEELVEFYRTEIGDEMILAGMNPETERPTYEWLADHGYSGIAYALREHHDLTVKEFITEEVGVGNPDRDDDARGYEWKIGDERTIERFEAFLRSRRRRQNRSEATIASKRSRLARYAREYETLHGTANLVERAGELDLQPAEIERVLAVFDVLDASLTSDDSKLKHLSDVNGWYVWLQHRAVAAYNPVATVGEEYGWKPGDETKPALRPDQIRAIFDAADGDAERLLVLALGAWGLRRGEVASLHVSQFVPNAEPPRIEFEDRKNGPSSVQLLFGLDAYLARVDALTATDWNGYLFPSTSSSTGHIAPGTVNNRFGRLAERANVTLEGDVPTPHACRRFWYNAYQEAIQGLREQIQAAAVDQGSASTSVVVNEYLGEKQARQARRGQMADRLADVFTVADGPG